MAVQAEWNGFTWGVTGSVRPITSLSSSRSVKVERNDEKEGEPATQTVALELMTIDLTYEAVLSATGRDPRDEYGEWWRKVGQYAPFYIGGRKYLADMFLLMSAKPSDIVMSNDGRWLAATIELSFEEYAEEASGLKTQQTAYSLSPGIYEQTAVSAVDVGPSERQKQGKMPANPGM